ncbi:capsular biosynthesis protein [Pokkaliibacter plantistimulans]|uniref:Capsular biosynthesis protein n=1 Tax=Proteobacteria bacterium 228 TaxID=2083153 RepID=A0A2S5KK04_9PROT|nr:polysaccharide biosynthesis/export family protein [Pokkaliibacter plantistimulans]PPC74965.1 capsular biosynthesis protein [Pokkaliibacter plantistimulans]
MLPGRVVFFLLMFLSGFSYAAEGMNNYQLGVGDNIKIQVYGEDELSMEVRISDSGTISYPFLGNISVAGKTIGQLESSIKSGLANGYLVDPNVNVAILEYRQFFMNGEVEKPGAYPYQPGLTLQKAISIAGGMTERASAGKMYITHDGQSADDAKRASMNDVISPGDTVTINQSFF